MLKRFLALALLLLEGTHGSTKIWNSRLQNFVDVEPEDQHIPRDPAVSHLRPLSPTLPKADNISFFIGIAAFRDSIRCGRTLHSAFHNSTGDPARIFIGVVDQLGSGEKSCVDEYCELVKKEGIRETKPEALGEECPYRSNVRTKRLKAKDSRGPTVARAYQQELLQDEEFCLQIDAHSIFAKNWDRDIVADWLKANNEMAVLSTYIHDCDNAWAGASDTTQLPHLCATTRAPPHGMIRNEGASSIVGAKKPQLSHLWGAGFSFTKCHAERRVRVDPHTPWIFDGEEFLRAIRLWTHGYDIYTPSTFTVCHDYKPVPYRYDDPDEDPNRLHSDLELLKSSNRIKKILGQTLEEDGELFEEELDHFLLGDVRTRDKYFEFSGINLQKGQDADRCHQLYWVSYDTDLVSWPLLGYDKPKRQRPRLRQHQNGAASALRTDYTQWKLPDLTLLGKGGDSTARGTTKGDGEAVTVFAGIGTLQREDVLRTKTEVRKQGIEGPKDEDTSQELFLPILDKPDAVERGYITSACLLALGGTFIGIAILLRQRRNKTNAKSA